MPRLKGSKNKPKPPIDDTIQETEVEVVVEPVEEYTNPLQYNVPSEEFKEDPNMLHTRLLKEHGLAIDFDVIEGSVTTEAGIIQLEKPTLVIRARYVTKR